MSITSELTIAILEQASTLPFAGHLRVRAGWIGIQWSRIQAQVSFARNGGQVALGGVQGEHCGLDQADRLHRQL